MDRYNDLLEHAKQELLDKAGADYEEVIEEAKANATIEFYQEKMLKKEPIGVVFSTIRADGTKTSITSSGVQIIMAPPAVMEASFAQINRVHKVSILEVDAANKIVRVVGLSKPLSSEKDRCRFAIKKLYKEAKAVIEQKYASELENSERETFEKHCRDMDMDTEEDAIKTILSNGRARKLEELMEQEIGVAYKKKESGEELTKSDQLFCSLILPARVFSKRESQRKDGSAIVKGMVDLCGLKIPAIVPSKYWQNRFTSDDEYLSILSRSMNTVINVAIVGIRYDQIFCSRRVLKPSPWENIEEYFKPDDVISIMYVGPSQQEGSFFGRLVTQENGQYGEYQDINILCDYPSSKRALELGVTVQPGGVYLAKVHKVNAEKHLFTASVVRNAGKIWSAVDEHPEE